MGIEITNEIAALLANVRPSFHGAYLEHAWNACCDGVLLQRYGIIDDLWDGSHEDLRRETEAKILAEIIDGDRETTDGGRDPAPWR